MPFSISEINKRVEGARTSFNSTLDKAGEKSGVFKPKPPPRPSAGNKSWGSKIDTARTSFNSTLDKAGHKSGVFKAPPPPPPSSSGSGRSAGILPAPPSTYRAPPPPPRRAQQAPPLPTRTSAESHAVVPPQSSWQPRQQAATLPSQLSPPPPYSQATRPAPATSVAAATTRFPPITQFTATDKQAFFTLIDEFFAGRGRAAANRPPAPTPSLAPPIANLTRPAASRTPSAATALGLPLSSCSGRSLAMWIVAYTQWSPADTNPPWYATGNPYPPSVLQSDASSGDLEAARRAAGWSQGGDERSAFGHVLYPDLSQCWFNITHSARAPWPPKSTEALYRPPPDSRSSAELAWAAEVYGTHLAEFAEQALASGQPVARGECWDLAAEGLKSFDYDPKPLPSTGRTHGVMLWRGSVGTGEWIGDEGRELGIRRGDIIEWRRAKCQTVRPHTFATLGDPDHTAIITAAPGNLLPRGPVPPPLIGELTVVEQSLGSPPSQSTYDLATLSEGQVWIYRAFSEGRLLGEDAGATWPPGGDRLMAP